MKIYRINEFGKEWWSTGWVTTSQVSKLKIDIPYPIYKDKEIALKEIERIYDIDSKYSFVV